MKKDLVDTRTAAAEIKVSEAFLRSLARENKIPFYKLSARTLRFDLNEIRDYMRMVANGKTEHGE